MTTKPEVMAFFISHKYKWGTKRVGVRLLENHDPSRVHEGWNYEPLVRLSDYEALQAECERLDRESQNLSDQLGRCDRERLKAMAECEQWKNSASGAHQQLTENRIETERLAVDWSKAMAECEKLRKLATECADYLDTNDMTSISHGSILHRKLLDAARQGDKPRLMTRSPTI